MNLSVTACFSGQGLYLLRARWGCAASSGKVQLRPFGGWFSRRSERIDFERWKEVERRISLYIPDWKGQFGSNNHQRSTTTTPESEPHHMQSYAKLRTALSFSKRRPRTAGALRDEMDPSQPSAILILVLYRFGSCIFSTVQCLAFWTIKFGSWSFVLRSALHLSKSNCQWLLWAQVPALAGAPPQAVTTDQQTVNRQSAGGQQGVINNIIIIRSFTMSTPGIVSCQTILDTLAITDVHKTSQAPAKLNWSKKV